MDEQETEIDFTFELECPTDIDKQFIASFATDWIVNYDDGVITLKGLRDMEQRFVDEDLYHFAESVKRAIKAINIIFE